MKVNCGTRTLYNAQCEFCCCMRNEIITWKGCDIMKKANATIDFVKFIGSIVIFALHCNALSNYPSMPFLLELMARWGVPFYFICSAFFLFRSRENDAVHKKTIIQYTRRIGCLYLLWFVYNLPNVIYKRIYVQGALDIGTYWLFIKNAILSSTFTGSWYLLSSVFSAWIVYFLSKKFKTVTVLKITSPLYLICALSSAYRGLLPPVCASILSFLCFPLNIFNGCFYFAIGKFVFENQAHLTQAFNAGRSCCCVVVFYILYIIEILLTKRLGICGSTDVAFSTACIAFFLFMFCLNMNIETKHSLLLRKCSTIVYCCQGNVLLVNGFLKQQFH